MQESIYRSPLRWTVCLSALVTLFALSSAGCKSKNQPETPAATTPAAQTQPAADQAANTTPMSLDDLVAPIALYPDQLLGQMLIASMNSQEVLDLGNWLIQNQNIKTDQAPDAAKNAGFSASAQYLAAFPQVVDNMCQEMDWTQQLGTAFKADQKGVMAAIQRKRAQAKQTGNLQSSPQMTVDTKTDNGQQVIQIAPANPQVIYVPQYNTQTVYVTPAPATTTTTTTTEASSSSGVSTGAAVGIGLLSFGVGMAVGSALHHDDYYPYPSWGYGGMYYGGRPYYPPPYRAPVYAGYRPASVYRPPSNYQWNQYNRNTNINVNNNNYYGRYHNNSNPAGGRGNNSGYLGARNDNNSLGNNRGNAPGQSGYQGARPEANRNERPGASMAGANPEIANRSRDRNPGANRNVAAARPEGRPNAGTAAARPNAGASNLSASPAAASNRPANMPGAGAGGGDRGFGGGGGAGSQPSRAAAENRASNRGGAFGGGNSSGSADRAASSRGHSSMGASEGVGRQRHR